jgi:methylated-DNA-[protein]-cysteine S-methyltransferase
MPSLTIDTPTGPFTLIEEASQIVQTHWRNGPAPTDSAPPTDLLAQAAAQVQAYFNGSRQSFDLPLRVNGSDFQQKICSLMLAIPFGDTRTYGDLAKDISAPPQAVGQACGGNPIPLIIPCHRILSAKGLGGFSGGTGLETKIQLLRHEGAAGLLI